MVHSSCIVCCVARSELLIPSSPTGCLVLEGEDTNATSATPQMLHCASREPKQLHQLETDRHAKHARIKVNVRPLPNLSEKQANGQP